MEVFETDARLVEILLVEDNPGDVLLTREALKEGKVLNNLHVAHDGEEALKFLHQRRSISRCAHTGYCAFGSEPAKVNGREVLAEVKSDPVLRRIPVVVLDHVAGGRRYHSVLRFTCELLYCQTA